MEVYCSSFGGSLDWDSNLDRGSNVLDELAKNGWLG
jgi:hypothetical protein